MSEPGYVAPASKILTVLHVPDDGEPAYTRCGLLMDVLDLWQPVRRDSEPVCPRCLSPEGTEEEQGALI